MSQTIELRRVRSRRLREVRFFVSEQEAAVALPPSVRGEAGRRGIHCFASGARHYGGRMARIWLRFAPRQPPIRYQSAPMCATAASATDVGRGASGVTVRRLRVDHRYVRLRRSRRRLGRRVCRRGRSSRRRLRPRRPRGGATRCGWSFPCGGQRRRRPKKRRIVSAHPRRRGHRHSSRQPGSAIRPGARATRRNDVPDSVAYTLDCGEVPS